MRVASFLDHWVNYPERFASGGTAVLPDEIWVGDEDALAVARRDFPVDRLRLEPNPYFEDLRDELRRITPPLAAGGLRVLYVSEPVAAHYGDRRLGYDEFDALSYCLRRLAERSDVVVRLRAHPAERADKYRSLIEGLDRPSVHLSSGTSLLEDCVWADWVVGCESTAMVVGLLAGREVYTSIPPGGRPCVLPHKAIRPL